MIHFCFNPVCQSCDLKNKKKNSTALKKNARILKNLKLSLSKLILIPYHTRRVLTTLCNERRKNLNYFLGTNQAIRNRKTHYQHPHSISMTPRFEVKTELLA